ERRLRVLVEKARLYAHVQQAWNVAARGREVDPPVDLCVDALDADAALIDVPRAVLAIRAEVARRERHAAYILPLNQIAELIAGRELRSAVGPRRGSDQWIEARIHALLIHGVVTRDADRLLELDLEPVDRERHLLEDRPLE